MATLQVCDFLHTFCMWYLLASSPSSSQFFITAHRRREGRPSIQFHVTDNHSTKTWEGQKLWAASFFLCMQWPFAGECWLNYLCWVWVWHGVWKVAINHLPSLVCGVHVFMLVTWNWIQGSPIFSGYIIEKLGGAWGWGSVYTTFNTLFLYYILLILLKHHVCIKLSAILCTHLT